MSTVSGTGSRAYSDGAAKTAQFQDPHGITLDERGTIYLADTNNGMIRTITLEGTVSTLAGSRGFDLVDGLGSKARFNAPHGLAIDTQGNLYIADTGNSRIRKITPAGQVTTIAGSGVGGHKDGPGASAQFSQPKGIAIDAQNNLYIADTEGHRIRKISPTGVVSTLAGTGSAGFADGDNTMAQFYWPSGVAVDQQGTVYVADYGNHRIRAIDTRGNVRTLAGSGVPGYTDGESTAAQFNTPFAVAVDHKGIIYVSDNSAYIRRITATGRVSTLAGTGIRGFKDGPASAAQFELPQGIVTDANGAIYLADTDNQRIRKISQL